MPKHLSGRTVVAFVGLGSNEGDRWAAICSAIARMNDRGIVVARVSPVYETEHVGDATELRPSYLNCVTQVQTTHTAAQLLAALLAIETEMGRRRPYRNAPRPIDLDLLLFGDESHEALSLTVPHPRMMSRAFVLRPLLDIAPEITVSGTSVARRLADPAIADQAVRPWVAP